MNIINGKEIYEHWCEAINTPSNMLLKKDVYLNFIIAPMVISLPVNLLEDIWVQFDRDELNFQKCLIQTFYDGILLRKFNPFTDKEITCYFEKDFRCEEQSLKLIKNIFTKAIIM